MDEIRKIANEKLRQNSACRDALLSLICSGEAIAFVGAGLSSPLKYPSWPALLAKLHAQAQQIAAFDPPSQIKQDVLQYAQAIKEHFTKSTGGIEQYRNTIGREFGPRVDGENCTRTHRCLARLPFRAFVTTNYDVCIEQALQDFAVDETGNARPDPGVIIKASNADCHLVSLFLRSISERTAHHRCHVAHLHGRWDDTQNIIFTATDYADAYDGNSVSAGKQSSSHPVTLHRQLAWSLFATRRMVFVGCSMDDPYIRRLLDTVAKDLWEIYQPIHFAILPLDESILTSPENQEAAFLRYGLQVVYFDNLNGTFTGLDQLFAEALEKSPPDRTIEPKSFQRSSTVQTKNSEPTKATRPTSERAEVAITQAWLEEVNKNTVASLRKNED